MVKKPSYKETVLSQFSESYIHFLSEWMYEALLNYIECFHLQESVYINADIFSQCVKDLVDDLVRLCQFHDIKYPNNAKIYSYMASWIIKRKPIQLLTEPSNPKAVFHNENAAYALILTETDIINSLYYENNKEELNNDLKQIMYHLKYRNTDPRTMMLLIDALRAGVLVRLPEEY